MRAIVQILALVHVLTGQIIAAQRKSSLASANVRSDEIDANVRAISIVLDTLVDVTACKSILLQLVAVMACTVR